MIIREVRLDEKQNFDAVVPHPMQSWAWGDFKEKTGVEVIRLGAFEGSSLVSGVSVNFHKLPYLPFTIGYIPKAGLPSREMVQAIKDLAKRKNAIFIKLEPNVAIEANSPEESVIRKDFDSKRDYLFEQGCIYGKPIFTKYSFILDLLKTEEELLGQMKQKTRYNVNLAKKKGVVVEEDNSPEAFEDYLHLTFEETTVRQKFYSHDRRYHIDMWRHMREAGFAHLFKAHIAKDALATWVLFVFNGVLYYPYGASSSRLRQLMASNLMMWEVIKFGRAQGCSSFDMWGSLGPNPNPSDPWIGFHNFKDGYGPKLMEFLGTFDLVIDPAKYQVYNMVDKVRWHWLKLRASLPF